MLFKNVDIKALLKSILDYLFLQLKIGTIANTSRRMNFRIKASIFMQACAATIQEEITRLN